MNSTQHTLTVTDEELALIRYALKARAGFLDGCLMADEAKAVRKLSNKIARRAK